MSDHRPAFGVTDVLLLLMAVIWGVNFSSIKYASGVFSPLTFVWLRVMLAAVTLLAAALVQRGSWPPWRDVATLLGLGIIGNGVYQLLFVNGVARTRIADAALIVASAPAVIAVMSRLRGLERLRPRAMLGIALSILGVGIVIIGSTHLPQQEGSLLGVTLVVIAVVCWSFFTVGLRHYTLRITPVQINALTMLGGVIPLMFLTPFALQHTDWRAIPALGWYAALYSSVISMGVAYLLWYRGVRSLGPTRTSVYGNLQPVVAIAVAWGALHEVPTIWQGAGAAVIIVGLLLTRV